MSLVINYVGGAGLEAYLEDAKIARDQLTLPHRDTPHALHAHELKCRNGLRCCTELPTATAVMAALATDPNALCSTSASLAA